MKFYARMMDAATGGEGAYEFDSADDLMKKPADEIVAAFFDYVDKNVLVQAADWELNSALKSKERRVVTAMGSLIPSSDDAPMPFLLMISDYAPKR